MRSPVSFRALMALCVATASTACSRPVSVSAAAPAPSAAAASATSVNESDVRRLLGALAHDSMEGRGTGTVGSERAARFIAGELGRYGVQPAGDSGFFQRVPVALRVRNGRTAPALLPTLEARDTVPSNARANAVNVVGVIPGADPI